MKNKPLSKRCCGWTLVELMVSLGMLAILACLATPSLQQCITRYQVRTVTHEIENAVRVARNLALVKGQSVYLCPLEAGLWSQGIQLKQGLNTILYTWDWKKYHVKVTWQGFQGKMRLAFASHPYQARSNGTFWIRKNDVMQKLILNRLGHIT